MTDNVVNLFQKKEVVSETTTKKDEKQIVEEFVREDFTEFFDHKTGQTIVRANHWDSENRYSTNTFQNYTDAINWKRMMDNAY